MIKSILGGSWETAVFGGLGSDVLFPTERTILAGWLYLRVTSVVDINSIYI